MGGDGVSTRRRVENRAQHFLFLVRLGVCMLVWVWLLLLRLRLPCGTEQTKVLT